MRPYQNRTSYSIKEEPSCQPSYSTPSLFSNTSEPMDRVGPTRRASHDQSTSMYRSNWMQASDFDHGASQAPLPSQFPWERQDGQTNYVHPSSHAGWSGAVGAMGLASFPPSDHGRRGYIDPSFASSATPSGLPSFGELPHLADFPTQTEMLQSEFFVGAMPSRHGDECWASLDPSMLTAQGAERVRVESATEHGQNCSHACPIPAGSGASPCERSTMAADTCFPVDFRNLSENAAPVAPPNAEQVERIMADLGIDLGSSQSSAIDPSRTFSSQSCFAQQPETSMAAAPLIPSQTAVSAAWAGDRFAPSASSYHQHSFSQAQSSQSSAYLPSLTASQSEALGPNATSRRRSMERSWSSASMTFDNNSQTHVHRSGTQSYAGESHDTLIQPVEDSNVKCEAQETVGMSLYSDPNFNKPHESSPSQRAARVEEGEEKSARNGDSLHQATPLPNVPRPTASDSKDVAMNSPTDNGRHPDIAATIASDNAATSTRSAGQDHVSFADAVDKSQAEVDKGLAPSNHQQQHASASTSASTSASASVSTSAVSGDQLQLVVDRFRAFAQLCQNHLHPSVEMLESLTPLIPKVIRTAAPIYHPFMLGQQKAHSSEEAFALLSLASLQSTIPNVAEEGHRLICFLFGLVVLSCRHTLHLGAKLQCFLNCFLLVGMYGMRQHTPDLWHKFEQNRESILLDVLKVETRSSTFDVALDRIDTDSLDQLDEQELSELWSLWYEHESRKRTLLLCAILDSQSSCYFSPFEIDLSARLEGPRCQFVFAHVHEPCPDSVFFAWPPKVWKSRLATSTSLPSSKGAKVAFSDGKPVSIAACLAEQLLRPHVANQPATVAPPRFRSSFDFGASRSSTQASKPSRSHADNAERTFSAVTGAFVEVTEPSSSSARSSRRPSHADVQDAESETPTATSEVRIVPQLYMSALLEAVHGAWMVDSGWYQTPAWGTGALPEQLEIDADHFDIQSASLIDLPGWRIGRTLHATRVAHALMNWSEMFSGSKNGCHTNSDEAAAGLGLKVTDDAQQLTIRWQTIFLGLCAPLQSLCFYLATSKRSSAIDQERHEKIALLLQVWAESPYCRRALVHAGTILTLLCAARTKCKKERLAPASSHAVYMSLVVLVCTIKLLDEKRSSPQSTNSIGEHVCEELIPAKQAWPHLVLTVDHDNQAKVSDAKESRNDTGTPTPTPTPTRSQDWLRVQFWHRKFQYLGLAGIFREHEVQEGFEVLADWRASVSVGAGPSAATALRRASHLPPRWSSFAGEGRLSDARRAIFDRHMAGGDVRQASHAQLFAPQQNTERDLQRRHHRNSQSKDGATNASSETRRWILQGDTRHATFCGLALWRADVLCQTENGVRREGGETRAVLKQLDRQHLRTLVESVRDDNPAWCFAQEYSELVLKALQDASTAETQATRASPSADDHNHHNHECVV